MTPEVLSHFSSDLLATGFRPDRPERIHAAGDDTDTATRKTVERMCRHIRDAQRDPLIKRHGAEVRARWAKGSANPRATAWAVFWYCKSHVRFKSDEAAVLALLNTVAEQDLLISPHVLLNMRPPEGDCDDFTMLACSLLQANGIPWEIVTVACDPMDRRRWSHVYLRAVMPDGVRLALDPTNGPWPGWEVPARDCSRRQVWNMDGQPITAPASWRDNRMHAYRRQRRGFGQSGEVPVENAGMYVDPGIVPAPSFWSSPALTSIINNAFKLGQIAITPSGAVVTQPGFTVANQAGLPTTLPGGIGIGSVLVWGGLALVGVLLISAAARR